MSRQKLQVQTPDFTLPPGKEVLFQVTGNFIRCLAATSNASFLLAVEDGNFFEFKTGRRVSSGELYFDSIRLLNPGASAITVKLAVGIGDMSDDAEVTIENPSFGMDPNDVAAIVGTAANLSPVQQKISDDTLALTAKRAVWIENTGAGTILVNGGDLEAGHVIGFGTDSRIPNGNDTFSITIDASGENNAATIWSY